MTNNKYSAFSINGLYDERLLIFTDDKFYNSKHDPNWKQSVYNLLISLEDEGFGTPITKSAVETTARIDLSKLDDILLCINHEVDPSQTEFYFSKEEFMQFYNEDYKDLFETVAGHFNLNKLEYYLKKDSNDLFKSLVSLEEKIIMNEEKTGFFKPKSGTKISDFTKEEISRCVYSMFYKAYDSKKIESINIDKNEVKEFISKHYEVEERKSSSSDMKKIKFETLIADINIAIIRSNAFHFSIITENNNLYKVKPFQDTSLSVIFDYDKLNDYGKIIMENSKLWLTYENSQLWKYTNIEEFKNQKFCTDKAKELVEYCRIDENKQEGYKLIFWSLMVLTVDKTDVEEKLSLICDFVKMLNITDAELEDIIHVIKIVYNEVEKEYQFKTETIPNTFGKLFNLYKNNEIPIDTI